MRLGALLPQTDRNTRRLTTFFFLCRGSKSDYLININPPQLLLTMTQMPPVNNQSTLPITNF